MIQIPASAAPDIQEAFRQISRELFALNGDQNIDLHGRRIINAGAAVDDADYVTKAVSTTVVNPVGFVTAGVNSIAGTANQVSASTPQGNVTLSLPQSIATTSTPQFARLGLGAAADGTALLSVSGKLLALAAGTLSKYNNVATAGLGVPAVYAAGRITAQTAAATITTYTVGAADGSFIISANVNVTTSTVHNFTVTCAYTDETNTARTLTMSFSQLTGAFITAITNVTGAGPYEGIQLHIRCKAATSITLATVGGGGFTTVTYNAEGLIEQAA